MLRARLTDCEIIFIIPFFILSFGDCFGFEDNGWFKQGRTIGRHHHFFNNSRRMLRVSRDSNSNVHACPYIRSHAYAYAHASSHAYGRTGIRPYSLV